MYLGRTVFSKLKVLFDSLGVEYEHQGRVIKVKGPDNWTTKEDYLYTFKNGYLITRQRKQKYKLGKILQKLKIYNDDVREACKALLEGYKLQVSDKIDIFREAYDDSKTKSCMTGEFKKAEKYWLDEYIEKSNLKIAVVRDKEGAIIARVVIDEFSKKRGQIYSNDDNKNGYFILKAIFWNWKEDDELDFNLVTQDLAHSAIESMSLYELVEAVEKGHIRKEDVEYIIKSMIQDLERGKDPRIRYKIKEIYGDSINVGNVFKFPEGSVYGVDEDIYADLERETKETESWKLVDIIILDEPVGRYEAVLYDKVEEFYKKYKNKMGKYNRELLEQYI